jgi:anti-sigma-K factor RskA
MAHDELHESSGVYALGLLEGEERQAFEAHLATCVECQAEVRAFGHVARGLDLAVHQHEPPSALRERVLARVPPSSAAERSPNVSSRSGVLPYWLAAAAAIAAIAVGLHAANLRNRVEALEDELVDARSEASALRQDLETARVRGRIAQRVTYVLAASDVTRVDLAGQAPAPSALGRAFWSPSKGLIFAAELPTAPEDRVYQLWVVKDTGPVSAGLLTSEPPGALTLVTEPIDARGAQALAVTLEPAGGVPAPTGPMYLVGKL